MSEISKRYASDSTVVDTATTVSRVAVEGAAYLCAYNAYGSTGTYNLRFTDGVGGTKKWEHQVGFNAALGSMGNMVTLPFPIRFETQIVASSGGEQLLPVSYILE